MNFDDSSCLQEDLAKSKIVMIRNRFYFDASALTFDSPLQKVCFLSISPPFYGATRSYMMQQPLRKGGEDGRRKGREGRWKENRIGIGKEGRNGGRRNEGRMGMKVEGGRKKVSEGRWKKEK